MAQQYDPYGYDPDEYEDPFHGQQPAPWIPPVANPNTNTPPDLYHEPAGNTGGWIDGIGQTIAPGSSITPAQRDSYTQGALGQGISQGWIDAYIARNPNDFNRLEEAYFSDADQEDTRTGAPNVTEGGGGHQTPTQQWNNQPPPAPAHEVDGGFFGNEMDGETHNFISPLYLFS